MQKVRISDELARAVPAMQLSCIECDVIVQEKNNELWEQIVSKINELNIALKVEDISKLPAIAASRLAYKACGKDPARYRLSAEALLRRVVNRAELYQVNNVVDALNLVSITYGFSIGGYDSDKILGEAVFGIGEKDELYEGIGRGELNIESMPVFRDDLGAFGTPTSDSVRTSVTINTKRFLMIIIDYGSAPALERATQMAVDLLGKFANASNFELKLISNKK